MNYAVAGLARVGAVLGLLALIGAVTPASAGPTPTPTMTATPDTGLVDGQWIQVSGTGFTDFNPAVPGSQLTENFMCRSDAVSIDGCDPDNAYDFDIAPDGTFTFDFRVDARITTASGLFDCRSAVQACKIGVGLVDEPGSSEFVLIDFDPAAPLEPAVTATVTPSTGLVDGQTVTVRGENLFPMYDTLTVQCGRAAEVPYGCDFDNAIRLIPPEPDGTIERQYPVRSAFRAATGEEFDCVTGPEPCVMLVSIGATSSPDRLATVPLAFTPAPAPTAPPSGPVAGSPGFTG